MAFDLRNEKAGLPRHIRPLSSTSHSWHNSAPFPAQLLSTASERCKERNFASSLACCAFTTRVPYRIPYVASPPPLLLAFFLIAFSWKAWRRGGVGVQRYTASSPPPTSSFLPSPVRLLGYPADPLSLPLHPVFRPGRGGEERSKLEETAIVLLGAKRRRREGKKSGMARGRRLVVGL